MVVYVNLNSSLNFKDTLDKNCDGLSCINERHYTYRSKFDNNSFRDKYLSISFSLETMNI